MAATLVPLLGIQHDLYALPRGRARFLTYLHAITDGTDDAVRPPLVALNPMGKTKAPAAVDALIALGAEAVATDAIVEAQERLPIGLPELRVGLIVADDVEGGWTRR